MLLPKGFFKCNHGLRQGDPLSPYLIIIIADLLERMVAKAKSVGLVQDFPFRGGLSFLLFSSRMIIFSW